jgi:hypothetical protein
MVGNYCVVHGYHRPIPLRTVLHHIHPQALGGASTPGNLIAVCDNGHYNIHAILDALLHSKPPPRGTRKERALARQGFDAIEKYRQGRQDPA